jgi:hypothetical protein
VLSEAYRTLGDGDIYDDLKRRGLAYSGVPLRLHLGCGETVLLDYVNIDTAAVTVTDQNRRGQFVVAQRALRPNGDRDRVRSLRAVLRAAIGALSRGHRIRNSEPVRPRPGQPGIAGL